MSKAPKSYLIPKLYKFRTSFVIQAFLAQSQAPGDTMTICTMCGTNLPLRVHLLTQIVKVKVVISRDTSQPLLQLSLSSLSLIKTGPKIHYEYDFQYILYVKQVEVQ